ncbi:MAG TPA: 4Fe-4S binding protein [Chlorobiota bacterium]|nr:4Fe-4S binding protein [Chlorobiota bacterium]
MNIVTLTIPQEVVQSNVPSWLERLGAALTTMGAIVFVLGSTGAFETVPILYSVISLIVSGVGILLLTVPAGLRVTSSSMNTNVMRSPVRRRGLAGWSLGVALTLFYILLYWFPETLVHVVASLEPLSRLIRNSPADRWFLYGTLYTLAVLVFGVRMLVRYRHSRYHLLRTVSLITAQLVFAYLLPSFLAAMGEPELYVHYFWPLKYDYIFPSSLSSMWSSGEGLTQFFAVWTVAMTVVITPILTYFYGKRWYCSWICGCGALAETVGDPFRQNADTSLRAWKIERWMVHGVLLFITVVTVMLWLDHVYDNVVFGSLAQRLKDIYGFVIGAMFSGVIGVGFYPIFGSRVWCRFGCPMAAYLGILQKYMSRFRITTNGGQCISCGNCSTYCEMGIDVRAYAQRGENIVRASCVGCGVCASVCPRGVLRLESGAKQR